MDIFGRGDDGRFHYVFMAYCHRTGKFFIGSHSADEIDNDYLGDGTHLKAVVSRCGVSSFNKTVVELFDTAEQAKAREAEIVTRELIMQFPCYNNVAGGEVVHKRKPCTDEHRANISAANKGRCFSPEHCAKLSLARLGKRHSAETRAKISATQRGRHCTTEARVVAAAARKGERLSVEHRRKISEANRGKRRTPETRARISAAMSDLWRQRLTGEQRFQRSRSSRLSLRD